MINFGWTATQSASLKTCRSQIYLPGFAGFLVVCEDFELVFHDFLPIWSLLGHAWAIFSFSPYPRNKKQHFFLFLLISFLFSKIFFGFPCFSLIWSFLDKKPSNMAFFVETLSKYDFIFQKLAIGPDFLEALSKKDLVCPGLQNSNVFLFFVGFLWIFL